jgi:transposase
MDKSSTAAYVGTHESIKQDRTAPHQPHPGPAGRIWAGLRPGPEPRVLRKRLADATNELGTLARLTFQRAQAQWRELAAHLA